MRHPRTPSGAARAHGGTSLLAHAAQWLTAAFLWMFVFEVAAILVLGVDYDELEVALQFGDSGVLRLPGWVLAVVISSVLGEATVIVVQIRTARQNARYGFVNPDGNGAASVRGRFGRDMTLIEIPGLDEIPRGSPNASEHARDLDLARIFEHARRQQAAMQLEDARAAR